jgi:hypothetical protein
MSSAGPEQKPDMLLKLFSGLTHYSFIGLHLFAFCRLLAHEKIYMQVKYFYVTQHPYQI